MSSWRSQGEVRVALQTRNARPLSTTATTDVSNASRTLLFNIHSMAWDPELCAAFRVPERMLPRVVPSSHVDRKSVV